jgi:hypothetical protein
MPPRGFLSLCLGLLMISQPAYAQTPAAVSTTDRHHPFVEHLEQRYTQYLAAETRGDAAAYREVRTKSAYVMTLDQLKKLVKPESELGPMLQRVADLADRRLASHIRAMRRTNACCSPTLPAGRRRRDGANRRVRRLHGSLGGRRMANRLGRPDVRSSNAIERRKTHR